MTSFFRGRFEGKLDDKGRIFLPTTIHNALSAGKKELVITNGFSKGFRYLDVYPFSSWKNLEKNISKLSNLRAEVQAFQRFYLSAAQIIEPDKSQRILIPTDLRSYAGIQDTILFVGMGEKFEIWSKDQWTQLYDNLVKNFDETLKDLSQEKK